MAYDGSGLIDSIYIAGSLTAGLGNSASDADLFLLQSSGTAMATEMRQYVVDGSRVNVEWYHVDQVERLVDEVISFQTRRDELTALSALPGKIDFTVRLLMSEPVVSSAALDRIRQCVQAAAGSIKQTALNCLAAAVTAHLEDFIGACAEDDLATAAHIGQDLVACAGKALAIAVGDLYFGKKWVYKQLSRNPVAGFPMAEFTTYQRGGWQQRGRTGAEALAFFAQTCVAVSQLLGGHGVSPGAWPSWPSPAARGSGLWRHPGYGVFREPDSILLNWGLHRQLALEEPAAIVWALCDGREQAAVVADVGLLAVHVDSLKPLTPRRIAMIIRALREHGVVGSRPFRLLDAACGAAAPRQRPPPGPIV